MRKRVLHLKVSAQRKCSQHTNYQNKSDYMSNSGLINLHKEIEMQMRPSRKGGFQEKSKGKKRLL